LNANIPNEAAAKFEAALSDMAWPTLIVVVAGRSNLTKSTKAMGSEAMKKVQPSHTSFEKLACACALDEDAIPA